MRSQCCDGRIYCCISVFFFFKQKTAYEMRISDWSSDVCSSDLAAAETSVGAAPVDSTETLRIASLTMLFAVQVIVPLNFQLDLGHRLDFVRKPRGLDELGIDLGEIHEGKDRQSTRLNSSH